MLTQILLFTVGMKSVLKPKQHQTTEGFVSSKHYVTLEFSCTRSYAVSRMTSSKANHRLLTSIIYGETDPFFHPNVKEESGPATRD